MQHITIYREPNRYGGWPANYGIWSWQDEIVAGFTLGHFKANVQFHARDKSLPFVAMQARSLDGGQTWSVDRTPISAPHNGRLSADEHMNPDLWVANTLHDEGILRQPPGDINFSHPDFALMCARTGLRAGARSWFYVSYDRCKQWEGPYRIPMFGQSGIAARTDYLVSGPDTCTFLLTAAKPDGHEGRVFCARTTDSGKSLQFMGWVTPEPPGYTIMPASVCLPSGRILCSVRASEGRQTTATPHCWIGLYASDDDGATWQHITDPVADSGRGGNPPTLTLLQDGRLCLTYGFRNPPCAICAITSEDNGKTWTEPATLREGAGNHDLGYPRTIQREDGKMVTVYYWNDDPDGERYIAATIWQP